MEQEFTSKRLLRNFTKDKMGCLTTTGEHLDGTLFQSKKILPVELCFH